MHFVFDFRFSVLYQSLTASDSGARPVKLGWGPHPLVFFFGYDMEICSASAVPCMINLASCMAQG